MKFKQYWDLIEEGIRLVSNKHVIVGTIPKFA